MGGTLTADEPAWVHRHAHEPNPSPPPGDASLTVYTPAGAARSFAVEDLQRLPHTAVVNCMIVSTGHGSSGPFTFEGVTVADLLQAILPAGAPWRWLDVIARDGFGARLLPADLTGAAAGRPCLLAYMLDGVPLTHERGLVRLIVPSEADDALRQVKWVERIDIH